MSMTQNATHTAEVFQVDRISVHPNADRLEIIHYEDFQTVVRKGDFQEGDLAVFIHPDTIVPTDREEFQFLQRGERTTERIKTTKLRGVISFGLVIPAPVGSSIGDDLFERLGLKHYDPDEGKLTSRGDCVSGPGLFIPKYDLEPLLKYGKETFKEGERVAITEKIHGQNARFVYNGSEMFCGTRNTWKKESNTDITWKAFRKYPGIADFCVDNPDIILYGEVYGQVQDLRYGHGRGEVSFAAFDILHSGEFCDYYQFMNVVEDFGIPSVPLIDCIPYDILAIKALAEGQSLLAANVREGVVVQSLTERVNDRGQRAKMKLVGCDFHCR